MTLASGTRLGPYEIVAPLGAGGMGEVYRARDERLDREVAIKVLPASFSTDADRLRRFEQEARSAGKLNHPNVLAIYDVGTHEGAPYVVSELLEGATLRERVASGPIPPRKAIDYALQLARGLGAAHEKGIVHRDLKPENVFLTGDGRVKILDFGLAKLVQPDRRDELSAAPTETRGTEPGVVLGTVGYMAPEQVRGLPADARTDIFAFGAILYEMLAGRRAFGGASSADVMSAILKEEPAPLAETGRSVPQPLDRLVSHCLEKNSEERFQSARDIAYELEALSGLSPSTKIPAVGGRAPRKVPLSLALLAVAAAAALGLLSGRIGAHPSAGVPVFHPLTFKRGSIGSARFAPDGQSVVYSAKWDGGPARLYLKRADAADSLALEAPASEILAIGADGEMLIALNCQFTHNGVCAGTLAREPLTGGAPRAVEENVQQADVARGGAMALVRDTSDGAQLEYPAPGKVLYKTAGHLSYPRISPKGDRIAFFDHPARLDDAGSVAIVDLAGKKTTLAGPFATEQGLAWSPDGAEVWFTAGETLNRRLLAVSLSGKRRDLVSSAGSLTLWDVAPTGRVLITYQTERISAHVLRRGEAEDRDVSWLNWTLPQDLSDDGKTILIDEEGGGSPSYMAALRPTDGSSLVRLGAGSPVALSPDGRWVLMRAHDAETLVPTGAGQTRALPASGLQLFPAASWFPDGKRILFSGAEPGHATRLYVRDLEGGSVRPISPEGFFLMAMSKAVSPDGRLALGAAQRRRQEGDARFPDGATVILPTDGSGSPRVVSGVDAKREAAVRWTEDGRGIFVFERGVLPFEIFKVDLATGARTPWMRIAPADLAGVSVTPLVRLSADGAVCVYSMQRLLSELYLLDGLRR